MFLIIGQLQPVFEASGVHKIFLFIRIVPAVRRQLRRGACRHRNPSPGAGVNPEHNRGFLPFRHKSEPGVYASVGPFKICIAHDVVRMYVADECLEEFSHSSRNSSFLEGRHILSIRMTVFPCRLLPISLHLRIRRQPQVSLQGTFADPVRSRCRNILICTVRSSICRKLTRSCDTGQGMPLPQAFQCAWLHSSLRICP